MAIEGGYGASGASGEFEALSHSIERSSLNFQILLSHFATFATVGVVAASAISAFANLQQTLTLTNAVAQGTARDFASMEDAVRKFAFTTQYSAKDAAGALYYTASAGYSVKESLAAMNGILVLAHATLSDVNESAQLVVNTLSSFGIEAAGSTQLANMFAAAINNSQAKMERLTYAMKQVAPVASAAGVGVEDLTASMMVLFNAGLRGEQTGTAMRNILTTLIKPTGDAAEAFARFGIVTTDMNGKMTDFHGVLQKIASTNFTEGALKQIFGADSIAAVSALIKSMQEIDNQNGNSEDKWSKLRGSIHGTQDAVITAAKQMDTFSGSAALARNALTELGLTIGDVIAPQLNTLLQTFTQLVMSFRELPDATKRMVVEFPIAAAEIYVAVKALQGWLGLMGKIKEVTAASAATGMVSGLLGRGGVLMSGAEATGAAAARGVASTAVLNQSPLYRLTNVLSGGRVGAGQFRGPILPASRGMGLDELGPLLQNAGILGATTPFVVGEGENARIRYRDAQGRRGIPYLPEERRIGGGVPVFTDPLTGEIVPNARRIEEAPAPEAYATGLSGRGMSGDRTVGTAAMSREQLNEASMGASTLASRAGMSVGSVLSAVGGVVGIAGIAVTVAMAVWPLIKDSFTTQRPGHSAIPDVDLEQFAKQNVRRLILNLATAGPQDTAEQLKVYADTNQKMIAEFSNDLKAGAAHIDSVREALRKELIAGGARADQVDKLTDIRDLIEYKGYNQKTSRVGAEILSPERRKQLEDDYGNRQADIDKDKENLKGAAEATKTLADAREKLGIMDPKFRDYLAPNNITGTFGGGDTGFYPMTPFNQAQRRGRQLSLQTATDFAGAQRDPYALFQAQIGMDAVRAGGVYQSAMQPLSTDVQKQFAGASWTAGSEQASPAGFADWMNKLGGMATGDRQAPIIGYDTGTGFDKVGGKITPGLPGIDDLLEQSGGNVDKALAAVNDLKKKQQDMLAKMAESTNDIGAIGQAKLYVKQSDKFLDDIIQGMRNSAAKFAEQLQDHLTQNAKEDADLLSKVQADKDSYLKLINSLSPYDVGGTQALKMQDMAKEREDLTKSLAGTREQYFKTHQDTSENEQRISDYESQSITWLAKRQEILTKQTNEEAKQDQDKSERELQLQSVSNDLRIQEAQRQLQAVTLNPNVNEYLDMAGAKKGQLFTQDMFKNLQEQGQTTTQLNLVNKQINTDIPTQIQAAQQQINDLMNPQKVHEAHATRETVGLSAGLPMYVNVVNLPAGMDAGTSGAGSPEALKALQDAIHSNEWSGKGPAPASSAGAVGPGQIKPDTWDEWKKKGWVLSGEDINNPQDNLAASNRAITGMYQQYGGDAGKVATAYKSGPGNVNDTPGATTPYKVDSDNVSGYVLSAEKKMGGLRAPANLTAYTAPTSDNAGSMDIYGQGSGNEILLLQQRVVELQKDLEYLKAQVPQLNKLSDTQKKTYEADAAFERSPEGIAQGYEASNKSQITNFARENRMTGTLGQGMAEGASETIQQTEGMFGLGNQLMTTFMTKTADLVDTATSKQKGAFKMAVASMLTDMAQLTEKWLAMQALGGIMTNVLGIGVPGMSPGGTTSLFGGTSGGGVAPATTPSGGGITPMGVLGGGLNLFGGMSGAGGGISNWLVGGLSNVVQGLPWSTASSMPFGVAGTGGLAPSLGLSDVANATFAKGGAWRGGVRFLAEGGLLDKATAFSDSHGMNVAGEAGTEAVMPLVRGPNGRLGVASHGGGNGGTTINYQPVITVQGGNAGGAKPGANQDQASQFTSDLHDGMMRLIDGAIAKHQRPGGLLYDSGESAYTGASFNR